MGEPADPERRPRTLVVPHSTGASRSGYFASGLPYNRLGDGPRPLIVFLGLAPDNAPLDGMMAAMALRPLRFLAEDRTVYAVGRRPDLPPGYTLEDMADDYARVVREELTSPIDVVGVSTGGSIAQVFAVRHAELVDRLVLYSAAHTLGPEGRVFQHRCAEWTRAGRWGEVAAGSLAFMYLPRRGRRRRLLLPLVSLVGRLIARFGRPPSTPSDYVLAIEAEDAFEFQEHLGEISAPTLVVAGERDPFYTPALFRETAQGIPGARLLLVEGGGHVPSGRRVTDEIRRFLAPPTARHGRDRHRGSMPDGTTEPVRGSVWTAVLPRDRDRAAGGPGGVAGSTGGPPWRSLPRGAMGFRLAHIVWGIVELAALIHVWACAWRRRRDRPLALAVALLLVQGAALAIGRGDCPLGPFQRRLGDPVPMFELVLPRRAAKAAIPVLFGVAVAGIVALLLRPPTGRRNGLNG